MLIEQNAFGSLDVSTANARLLRPAPHVLQADRKQVYQMAVMGPGMQVRAGAGVGSMQFRVVATPSPNRVITGLVSAGASVADDQYPGRRAGTPGGGWGGYGDVYWNLPRPAPARTVTFGQGDRVMVVLDCRQGPLVRLLVNSRPRQVHHLAPPAGGPIAVPAPPLLWVVVFVVMFEWRWRRGRPGRCRMAGTPRRRNLSLLFLLFDCFCQLNILYLNREPSLQRVLTNGSTILGWRLIWQSIRRRESSTHEYRVRSRRAAEALRPAPAPSSILKAILVIFLLFFQSFKT